MVPTIYNTCICTNDNSKSQLSFTSAEKLAELVTEAGFKVTENRYVQKETVNKKEGLCVPRIFIQGRFIKPVIQVQQTCTEPDTSREDTCTQEEL